MPLPKGKPPGQGSTPNDVTRHRPAAPPTSEGGQKPPTDANPTRQHHQIASEGVGGIPYPK